MMCWPVQFRHVLIIACACPLTTFALGASTTDVFVETSMPTAKLHTAADAAIAMNSIEFIRRLSSTKNTDDIKTYTQPLMHLPTVDRSSSADQWRFASRVFGRGDERPVDNTISDRYFSFNSAPVGSVPRCSRTHSPPNGPASRETIAEYIGYVWFLPRSKGIRFRETVRILSISADGWTSSLECRTQYYSGSQWVDCSNIICVFSRISTGDDGVESVSSDAEVKLKMALECELLVGYLPRALSRQIRKTIRNVFKDAALAFFRNLA